MSYFALLLLASLPTANSEIDKVVKKSINAHGGKAALSKANFLLVTGRISAPRHGSKPGEFVRLFRNADQLGVALTYPDMVKEVRYLRDGRGWRDGVEITGMPLYAMQMQAARMALPLSLLRERANITRRADVTRDGQVFFVLEQLLSADLNLLIEINSKTGLIERVIGTLKHGPHTVKFITDYSDFRVVGGVQFAFKEVRTIMGHHVADLETTTIEILKKDPGKEFEL